MTIIVSCAFDYFKIMFLRQQINEDLKQAMKKGDTVRRDVLRMLGSMIKNAEIEKKRRDEGLNDSEVQEVVSRAIKQRRDSVEQFKAGGRTDLVEKESREIEILLSYLPAQMSDEEIRESIKEVIAAMCVSGKAEMGKVMGQAMVKLKGKAEGNKVKSIVEEELSKLE